MARRTGSLPTRTNIPIDVMQDFGRSEEERSDYRAVPASDDGETYRDRGMLGFYQTDAQPFECPAGVRFDPGFGATDADLHRGWSDPLITEHPGYTLSNYKDRSSQPMEADVTPGNVEAMESDWAFRDRNRKSRGFLTRPRIPIERG